VADTNWGSKWRCGGIAHACIKERRLAWGEGAENRGKRLKEEKFQDEAMDLGKKKLPAPHGRKKWGSGGTGDVKS